MAHSMMSCVDFFLQVIPNTCAQELQRSELPIKALFLTTKWQPHLNLLLQPRPATVGLMENEGVDGAQRQLTTHTTGFKLTWIKWFIFARCLSRER